MKQDNTTQASGFRLAVPFFITLTVLTVVSFLVFLRPTQSYMEKRELAKFPEFSWDALMSGDYFDDITLWFSDTFPGREGWMKLSTYIASFHGDSAIAIQGESSTPNTPPQPAETSAPDESRAPDSPTDEGTEASEPTATDSGNSGAVESSEIYLGQAIQIDDAVFNQLSFDQLASDMYIDVISEFADSLADSGVRVISAPAPTSVGFMVEPELLEQIGCAPQDEIINYLHGGMSENVIIVDTYAALIDHTDEYIFFRTDHHWSALGAYYCYEAVCEALGLESAALESFNVLDQGEFQGSLYWKASWPYKLKSDNVYAYLPQGDITMEIVNEFDYSYEWPLIRDVNSEDVGMKYVGFLAGDQALCVITNNDIPDAPSCIVVKDSFGNCFVPFLTQNYHKIYAIDYRIFYRTLPQYLEKYENITDIIFLPNLIATQSYDGNSFLKTLCG